MFKREKKIKTSGRSNWHKDAEYRLNNKWLNYSSKIARRILSAIKEKEDFSQIKLAEKLEVSPQRISKIVKGKENLTLETIYNLSQALGVDLISFPDYKYSSKNSRRPIQFINMKSDQPNTVFGSTQFVPKLVSEPIETINKFNNIAVYHE